MKDSEKKSYIDGLSFGLKDRERTTEKYNDYKTTEFKKFLKDNHEKIKKHHHKINIFKKYFCEFC